MSKSIHEIVTKFCRERGLNKNRLPIENNGNREYVFVKDPMLFAGLAGEIKHQFNISNNRQVFLRGQPTDYPGMIPSLFRNLVEGNLMQRRQAYEELVANVYKDIPRFRFKGEIGGAILQHYGVNTPWLDLVDNIFIALWFACWKRNGDESSFTYSLQRDGFGWVYFLEFPYGIPDIQNGIISDDVARWCDLRAARTSLVLRAHVQHGIFGARNDYPSYDLNQFVVAAIKFPIKEFANLTKSIKPNFMFPSDRYDKTYKLLHNKEVNKLISAIEDKFELTPKTLGRVDKIRQLT